VSRPRPRGLSPHTAVSGIRSAHSGEIAVITAMTALMALGGLAMVYEMFVGQITLSSLQALWLPR
jgi:hypothetical protein